MNRKLKLWKVLLAMFALTIPASAQEFGETIIKRGVAPDDVYAAGGAVRIEAEVKGDVLAAGGTVTIDGRVDEDAMLAGASIAVHGPVADDLRAAGGNVTVSARIGDDALIAGGEVALTEDSQVGGNAWLAGNQVTVAGTVNGDLRATADTMIVSGRVVGDVYVRADTFRILPGAKIEGRVRYQAPREARIAPEAEVPGPVDYAPAPAPRAQPDKNVFVPVFLLIVLTAGVVLYLLFPRFTVAAATTVERRPLASLALGFALLVATPIAAIFLMAIVIGLWVGLASLAVYFVALAVGFLIGVFFIGDLGARLARWHLTTRSRRLLSLLAALILVGLLQWVPVVGGLISFLMLLLGIGAGSLRLHEIYKGKMLTTGNSGAPGY